MPTSMDEDSFLALGNSSLSTFLSTLLKDEEINKFELVVDNAKPDNNNSFRSLRFVEDTPKCKWYNLVGNDSDPDIRSARRGSKLRSHRSNANRRSTTFRRTVSDPSLCIQMPRRTASPIPVTQKKLIERKTARSESDLLRMPKTLQSPIVEKASLNCTKATRNATWDTAKLKKKNEMVNLFIDLMIEAEDDATEPISPNAAPICFKGEMTLATSCLWENPILSHEKKVLSMPRQPFGEPRRSVLTNELRKSLIEDIGGEVHFQSKRNKNCRNSILRGQRNYQRQSIPHSRSWLTYMAAISIHSAVWPNTQSCRKNAHELRNVQTIDMSDVVWSINLEGIKKHNPKALTNRLNLPATRA